MKIKRKFSLEFKKGLRSPWPPTEAEGCPGAGQKKFRGDRQKDVMSYA